MRGLSNVLAAFLFRVSHIKQAFVIASGFHYICNTLL